MTPLEQKALEAYEKHKEPTGGFVVLTAGEWVKQWVQAYRLGYEAGLADTKESWDEK